MVLPPSPPQKKKKCQLAHLQSWCQTKRMLTSVSMRLLWRGQNGQKKKGRGSGRRRPKKQRRPSGCARKWKLRRLGETQRPKRPEEWQRWRRLNEGPSRKKWIGKRLRDGKRLRHQWPADSSSSCCHSIKSPHGLLKRRMLGGCWRLAGNLHRVELWGTERGKCQRNMFVQIVSGKVWSASGTRGAEVSPSDMNFFFFDFGSIMTIGKSCQPCWRQNPMHAWRFTAPDIAKGPHWAHKYSKTTKKAEARARGGDQGPQETGGLPPS